MPKQMKTGIAGLDQILDGGFLYHNSILLKGPPGSGKTTLGIQIVYNGAVQFDEPGIIVLFEQFPQQLYRDVSSYSWDIEGLSKSKKLAILFAEPEEVIAHERVSDSPLLSRIQDATLETGAKRILVDSLSHFVNVAKARMDSRDLLLRFINSLKSIGLTPILTAEKENVEGWIGFDEYLTDCVLLLSSEASKDKTFPVRQVEIRKTRGHNHLRGKHPYLISKSGIEVFPHRLPEPSKEKPTATGALENVPSGIAGFDDLLGGGYTRGTATVVAGLP
ncbi:MAG: ATPase domain-containing protein, partial [bacterium]